MKGVGESSDDRISKLPENVIHHILMLLPIKDAARTAFMSTKWRRHWRSIPQLVFDEGFAQITGPSMINNLILNIYQSLLVHDGPVTKFVLSTPGLAPCDQIDHIIVHLSGRGVQEFTLVLSGGDGHKYKLPSCLFTALQLNRLKLKCCLFMVPPLSVGFTKLTHLELSEVKVPSGFFVNFLHKSPLLEDLRLIYCDGLAEVLCVFGQFLEVVAKGGQVPSRLPTPLHRLNSLNVFGLIFGGLEMESILVCLIMSSPNLRELTIQPHSGQLVEPTNISVATIRSLLEAEDCLGSHSNCLQHLRVLDIDGSHGTLSELELVRFVLVTAPLLLRIRIKPHRQLGSKKVTKFMKEVMRYKRVSKEAEVIYDWNDDQTD